MATNVTPGEKRIIRMLYQEKNSLMDIAAITARSLSTVRQVTKDLRQVRNKNV